MSSDAEQIVDRPDLDRCDVEIKDAFGNRMRPWSEADIAAVAAGSLYISTMYFMS